MKNEIEESKKDYQRFPVYVSKSKLRSLRSRLALEGKSVSQWFRDKLEQELNRKSYGKS